MNLNVPEKNRINNVYFKYNINIEIITHSIMSNKFVKMYKMLMILCICIQHTFYINIYNA